MIYTAEKEGSIKMATMEREIEKIIKYKHYYTKRRPGTG